MLLVVKINIGHIFVISWTTVESTSVMSFVTSGVTGYVGYIKTLFGG